MSLDGTPLTLAAFFAGIVGFLDCWLFWGGGGGVGLLRGSLG